MLFEGLVFVQVHFCKIDGRVLGHSVWVLVQVLFWGGVCAVEGAGDRADAFDGGTLRGVQVTVRAHFCGLMMAARGNSICGFLGMLFVVLFEVLVTVCC